MQVFGVFCFVLFLFQCLQLIKIKSSQGVSVFVTLHTPGKSTHNPSPMVKHSHLILSVLAPQYGQGLLNDAHALVI